MKSSLTNENFAVAFRKENRFRVQLVSGTRTPSYLLLKQYVDSIQGKQDYPHSIIQTIGMTVLNEATIETWPYFGIVIRQFKEQYEDALKRFAKWLPKIDLEPTVDFYNNGGFLTGGGRTFPYNLEQDVLVFGEGNTQPVQKVASRQARRRTDLDIGHNSLIYVARPGWINTPPTGIGNFLSAFGNNLSTTLIEPRDVLELAKNPFSFSIGGDTLSYILYASAIKLAETRTQVTSDSLRSV